jgi:hypothetical protein
MCYSHQRLWKQTAYAPKEMLLRGHECEKGKKRGELLQAEDALLQPKLMLKNMWVLH